MRQAQAAFAPGRLLLLLAATLVAVLTFFVPHSASVAIQQRSQAAASQVTAVDNRAPVAVLQVVDAPTAADPPASPATPVITVDDGGDPATGAAARAALDHLLATLNPEGLRQLRAADVRLDLIPKGRKLTDLKDFTFLRGIVLAYGRGYDDVRGVGGVRSGPAIVYAVGAEEWAGPAAYGPGFELAHETGHVIRHYALSPVEERALKEAYATRQGAGGPWLAPSSYTAVNDDEYFAQSVAAYFEAPYSTGDAGYTRSWLAANDPRMAALLASVFPGA